MAQSGQPPEKMSLDMSGIGEKHECLQIVAKKFNHWYEKYSSKMSEPERFECQYALDHLTAAEGGMKSPGDNTLYRKYMGYGRYATNVRDLGFRVFYLLRLLYVKLYEKVMKLRFPAMHIVTPSPVCTANKFMNSTMARLVRERYGENIDLWTAEFPGSLPPRPQRWPPLGSKVEPLHRAIKDETKSQPSRKRARYEDQDSDYSSSGIEHPSKMGKLQGHGRSAPEWLSDTSEVSSDDEDSDTHEQTEIGSDIEATTASNESLANSIAPSSSVNEDHAMVEKAVSSVSGTGSETPRASLLSAESPKKTLDPETANQQPQHQSNVYEEIKRIHQREEERKKRDEKLYEAFMNYTRPLESESGLPERIESLAAEVKEKGRRISELEKQNDKLRQDLEAEKLQTKGLKELFENMSANLKEHFPRLGLGKAAP